MPHCCIDAVFNCPLLDSTFAQKVINKIKIINTLQILFLMVVSLSGINV